MLHPAGPASSDDRVQLGPNNYFLIYPTCSNYPGPLVNPERRRVFIVAPARTARPKLGISRVSADKLTEMQKILDK